MHVSPLNDAAVLSERYHVECAQVEIALAAGWMFHEQPAKQGDIMGVLHKHAFPKYVAGINQEDPRSSSSPVQGSSQFHQTLVLAQVILWLG